jgi:hypothetical protein
MNRRRNLLFFPKGQFRDLSVDFPQSTRAHQDTSHPGWRNSNQKHPSVNTTRSIRQRTTSNVEDNQIFMDELLTDLPVPIFRVHYASEKDRRVMFVFDNNFRLKTPTPLPQKYVVDLKGM